MNNFCTFYIVRHAQSEANVNHIISGHGESNLSPEGLLQAQLRSNEFKKIHFAAAFSSDLNRANQTAQIIAKEHQLEVTALKVLRERNYGSIQGMKGDELPEKLKKLLDDYSKMDYKKRFKLKIFPNMESDEEVIKRFETFLREIALAYPNQKILVVSHGNIMRTFLVHLGFATHRELSHETLGNTGYIVLRSDGVDFEVVKTVGVARSIAF